MSTKRVRVDLPLEVPEEFETVTNVGGIAALIDVVMVEGVPNVKRLHFTEPIDSEALRSADWDLVTWTAVRNQATMDAAASDMPPEDWAKLVHALNKLNVKGRRRYNRLSSDDLDKIAAVDVEHGGGAAAAEVVAGMYFVTDRTAERYLKQARERAAS